MIRLQSDFGYWLQYFVVFTPSFAIYKNVAHSLEPCKTPRCNVLKFRKTFKRCGCSSVPVIFSILLNSVLLLSKSIVHVHHQETSESIQKTLKKHPMFSNHVRCLPKLTEHFYAPITCILIKYYHQCFLRL